MFCGRDLPHAGYGVKVLPKGEYPKCGIINPNALRAATGAWTPIPENFHPVILKSTTPVALTTVCRARPSDTGNDTTTQEEYPGVVDPSTGILWQYIPFAGRWKVHHNAAAGVTFAMLDSYSPEAVAHFAGIRILGGSVSISATPGGAIVMAAPAAVSVGVASGVAVAANANRKFLYLHNTDATKTISLGFDGNAAVLLSGVTMAPGEWRAFHAPGEAPTTGAVAAISSGAATNMAVQEGS